MDSPLTLRLSFPFEVERSSVTTPSPDSEQHTSDEALIVHVSQNDRQALEVLFTRHARLLRGLAYRVLRDSSEADDLLQDVFLSMPRFSETFDCTKGGGRAWLLQVVYRRAVSRRRYLKHRHFYDRAELADARNLPENLNGRSTNHSENTHIDARRIWQKHFAELSEDQQRTLHLYFFESYTLPEVADTLGQSIGNVSHHFYRGLDKLRRCVFGAKVQVAKNETGVSRSTGSP